MYFTGFADEASEGIDGQIEVTKALGWKYIEARHINNCNLHDLPEADFEAVCDKLNNAGVKINCFGSAVANWSKNPFSEEDFKITSEQLDRAIVRMKKMNCKMLRGMSFAAQWTRPAFDPEVEAQVFPKVKALVRKCEEAGVLYLHENCNNYGGQSWKHTLKLIEAVNSPNFKLVFDTGNPVLNFDRARGDSLENMQNSFEFYNHVKEHIAYIHIKDGFCTAKKVGFSEAKYTYPGEGNGCVKQIVSDLLKNGYDGGFSMEPHMGTVFHDKAGKRNEVKCKELYIEYGKRFMNLVNEVSK